MAGTHRELVVYVHGLWLSGGEALFLRRRLERDFEFEVIAFTYPSVSSCMSEIVERLHSFVEEHPAPVVHFVGHSLGGIVVHRFLERFDDAVPQERVVLLGAPLVASRAAVSVARRKWLAPLIGRCVAEELLTEKQRRWTSRRPVGVIAGTQAVGLGRFFAHFTEECDGTVAVSETRIPGLTDHITLPVSHMGMLLSARVAHQTGYFLRNGRFSLSS